MRFQKALLAIRKLTVRPPEEFEPRMRELAAESGVAVVFVRELKKYPISGVARWLNPEKALIQLSLRYKTEDQLWSSFFHEAGHIMHDPKKAMYIDDGGRSADDEREEKANRFAAEMLIPAVHEERLRTLRTQTAVVQFAKEIGITPGIVVGRLQREGVLPWPSPLNALKRRFTWAAS